jgi:large subunit ribosomal protein L29e
MAFNEPDHRVLSFNTLPPSLVWILGWFLSFFVSIHVFLTYSLLYYCVLPLQRKNTCAHNNTHKAHANGIKKAKRTRYVNTRGMDPKFLRNQKFAKKYNGAKRVIEE